jgi:D-3-phosphoglycerate dehydrogenase/C-terminal binding protein
VIFVSRRPTVAIVDTPSGTPGGRYVEDLDIELSLLGAIAETRLEIVSPAQQQERLLALEDDYIVLWPRLGLDAEFFESNKHCRAVVCASAGYDHIDVAAARAADVPVFHVPDYGTEEVADHTLALALALARALPGLRQHTLDGGWDWHAIGQAPRLRGRVWGVVGLGRIGTAVARRTQTFGMRCVFYDPYVHHGIEKALAIERVGSLAGLLDIADVVSLHVPLNAGTRHLLGAGELHRMKRGSILVNTARGAIVDVGALRSALAEGRPGSAGLDVIEGEPLIPSWLRADPRALLTPHAGFYSVESLAELRTRAADTVAQLIAGRPVTSATPAKTPGQAP